MKNFVLTFILFTFTNCIVYSQFKNIGGDGKAIISNILVKGDTIYALSNSIMHKSFDGGLTWTSIDGSHLLGDIDYFRVNGDFIVAVDVKNDYDFLDMVIQTSIDGGKNWVTKDISRPDYFYGLYEDEINITIHNNIITVNTHEDIIVSKDFGVNFDVVPDKRFYHRRSDYIYYQNGNHYIIENNKVTKTNDFVNFTTVNNSASNSISGFFRDNNTIYIQNGTSLKLIDDAFEEVELDPLLFESENKYSYDEDFLYIYNSFSYELRAYDQEFNIVSVNDLETLIDPYSENDKFAVNGGFIYYYNTQVYGFYKKEFVSGSASTIEISKNIKGAKGEYILVDNRLWQITSRLSYYNNSAAQWQSPTLQYGQFDYGIVNKNEIFVTNPARILNLGGIKVRDSSIPNDYSEIFNCNDILMYHNFNKTKISTLIGGILPWIEINEEINWQKVKTEFSNGIYIIHDEIDEILYTSNKYTWEKITINPVVIENQKISSVQISEQGDIFISAGKSLYKANNSNNTWTKIIANSHPYPDQTITDFAMYKNVMIQTIYGFGVVISYDQGLNWQKFEDGLPNANMVDILISDTYVYVTNQFEVFELKLSDIPGLSSTENNLSQENKIITFYPNPTFDFLNYHMNLNEPSINVEILSSDGKMVFLQKISGQTNGKIDVSSVPSGIYFVKTSTEKESNIQKFVKL